MTDRPTFPTDDPAPRPDEGTGDCAEAWILRRRTGPPTAQDRLAHTFLCWAWEAGFPEWEDALRAFARTLRGLERTGLIERHTVRRAGEPPRHCLRLAEDGHAILAELSDSSKGGVR